MNKSQILRLIEKEKYKRSHLYVDAKSILNKKQISFVFDNDYDEKYTVMSMGRRAGKSFAVAVKTVVVVRAAKKLIKEAKTEAEKKILRLKFRGSKILYYGKDKLHAYGIIWETFIAVCKLLGEPIKVNEKDLEIKFGNITTFKLMGIKDKNCINTARGFKVIMAFIDECQMHPDFILSSLCLDGLAWALADYKFICGKCYLLGTPPPIHKGFFSDCWFGKKYKTRAIGGNIYDNYKTFSAPEIEEILDEEREFRGLKKGEENARFQREALGMWVEDHESLVFKMSEHNFYEAKNFPPLDSQASDWKYVYGMDFGFKDNDYICILAYSPYRPDFYLIREDMKNRQGETALMNRVKQLTKKYPPVSMHADPASGGLRHIDNIQQRFGLPIEGATKHDKMSAILLLKDQIELGHFKFPEDSHFAIDAYGMQWDIPYNTVDEKFHSDSVDGVLYGFRGCMNFINQYKKSTSEVIKEIGEALKTEISGLTEQEYMSAFGKDKSGINNDPSGRGTSIDFNESDNDEDYEFF